MFNILHCHSYFSLLDGLPSPKKVAARAKELGMSACALTDHGGISGAVQFSKYCKEVGVKPILGCEFYICDNNPELNEKEKYQHHLVVLAKNLQGWKSLVKLVSLSNKFFYYKPRLDMTMFEPYKGSLIAFSGHMGSELSNILFVDNKAAFNANYDDAKSLLKPDHIEVASKRALELQEIFGAGNFFIEIQLIDQEALPASKVVAEALREVSVKTGIPCVATPDAHYCKTEDAADQRIILCSALKTTLKEVKAKIDNGEDVGLGCFFKSNKYYMPSHDEVVAIHTEDEINNTQVIADMCEDYNLLGDPILPKFDCPNGMSENDYLRQLARGGWKAKLKFESEEQKKIYGDRAKEELDVLCEYGLAGYFLIVWDYLEFCKNKGWLIGPGRGSVGCSLIAYLIGITNVDPIIYNLTLERFINKGRLSKDRISLPDIDCDFPISKRKYVLEYIRNKYGRDKVAQIATFSRMQGRAALKDVLTAHSACSFDEMNRMTENVPDESKISDALQEMLEEDGEASILKWTLENHPEDLKEWVYLDENGDIQSSQGNFGNLFAQAIRLEGTKRSQGKHAAGVIISANPLNEICPLINDKNEDEPLAGMEMGDLEAMGLIKADILGLAALDKLMIYRDLLATGTYNQNDYD